MDRPRTGFGDPFGFLRVARLQQLIPFPLQTTMHQPPDAVLVIDQHHGRRRFVHGGRFPRLAGRQRLFRAREQDLEARPFPDFARRADVALALHDDGVHDREAEAGSGAGALGGEKWFEDAGQRRRVHSLPRIRYPNLHVPSRPAVAPLRALRGDIDQRSRDPHFPALRHRVARVQRQVKKYLLQPVAVAAHQFGRRAQLQCEPAARPQAASDQWLDLANHAVDVEHLRARHIAAAQRQQLLAEGTGQRGGMLDLGGPLPVMGVFQLRLQLFGAPQDHHQQIVKVVRQPTRQIGDRLQPLRLDQAAFHFPARPNVLHHQNRAQPPLLRPVLGIADFYRHGGSRFRNQQVGAALVREQIENRIPGCAAGELLFEPQNIHQRAAHGFGASPTGQLLRHDIHKDDFAGWIGGDDSFAHATQRGRKPGLA